jgi:phosphatidylinositol-3-phosphatase
VSTVTKLNRMGAITPVKRLAAVVLFALALAAYASSSLSSAQITVTPNHPPSVTHPSKVLVVMEENESFTQAWGGMPYLKSLALKYGYVNNNYHAVGNPSEPNYLAIAGGSTFGVTDDNYPSANYGKVGSAGTVFGQALSTGHTAKIFAEGMPSNCYPSNGGTQYAVKHNPWPYFNAEATQCKADDVPMGTAFTNAAQSNALPNVGMLVPNMCNDAHDCSLGTADNWLKATLPAVLNSADFTSGRLAVVVAFDGSSGGHESAPILAVVCDVNLNGKVVSTSLNHYSLSRWLSETVGAPPLLYAAKATDMRDAFGL